MTDRQVVHFHPRHRSSVMSGSKTTTVRWNESVVQGEAWFVFGDEPVGAGVPGRVTRVERHPASTLSARDAQQPTGTDMPEFVRQLRENYYPAMPDDAVLEIVTLQLDDR